MSIPLYPSESEIAVLVLGAKRAREWPAKARYLEDKHGLPRIDQVMGGRFWPAVISAAGMAFPLTRRTVSIRCPMAREHQSSLVGGDVPSNGFQLIDLQWDQRAPLVRAEFGIASNSTQYLTTCRRATENPLDRMWQRYASVALGSTKWP